MFYLNNNPSYRIYNMPITIHLDAMLVKRKISLTELSKAVGLSLTNLSMLKNNNLKFPSLIFKKENL